MASTYVVECAVCGKTAERAKPAKYCSRECKDRRPRNRNRQRNGGHRPGKARACIVCETVYRPKRATSKDGQKCCSRECGFEWRRIKATLLKRAVYRVWKPRKQRNEPINRCCEGCGARFEPEPYARTLCPVCREASRLEKRKAYQRTENGRASKSAARKARKLKLRGVRVEWVNPLKVLRRDRWTCQLCGAKTPQKLRGTYDDRAPEVDHIIPLADGGEHSYRNTQCACRKCNIAKAATPRGQLRLFG